MKMRLVVKMYYVWLLFTASSILESLFTLVAISQYTSCNYLPTTNEINQKRTDIDQTFPYLLKLSDATPLSIVSILR